MHYFVYIFHKNCRFYILLYISSFDLFGGMDVCYRKIALRLRIATKKVTKYLA